MNHYPYLPVMTWVYWPKSSVISFKTRLITLYYNFSQYQIAQLIIRCIEDRFLTQHSHPQISVRSEMRRSWSSLPNHWPSPATLTLFHQNYLCSTVKKLFQYQAKLLMPPSLKEQFTSEPKEALLHPLPKKAGIDLIFKNYRPISNSSCPVQID